LADKLSFGEKVTGEHRKYPKSSLAPLRALYASGNEAVIWFAQMSNHIPLRSLWEYSRNPNPTGLTGTIWDHLKNCESCVGILWACYASQSIEQVKTRSSQRNQELEA